MAIRSETQPLLGKPSRQLPQEKVFQEQLNLANVLLYSISVYSVVSTVGQYSESVGRSKAFSGILVTIAWPIATFANGVYTYIAARYSTKSALLISSTLALTGNLIYALAASFESSFVLALGRILIGLGGARSVNKQYIYDNAKDITVGYSRLVTRTALGMTFGSLLPWIFLQYFSTSTRKASIGAVNFYFDIRTNSSWLTVILWAVFIVWFRSAFIEPPHIEKSRRKYKSQIPINSNRKHRRFAFYSMVLWNTKMMIDLFLVATPIFLEKFFGKSEEWTDLYIISLAAPVLVFNEIVRIIRQRKLLNNRRQVSYWMRVFYVSVLLIGIFNGFPFFKNPAWSYLFFGMVVFAASNACESATSTLFKENFPRFISEKPFFKDIFSAGFINSFVGNLGKLCGGLYLSYIDPEHLTSWRFILSIFSPAFILAFVTVLTSRNVQSNVMNLSDKIVKAEFKEWDLSKYVQVLAEWL